MGGCFGWVGPGLGSRVGGCFGWAGLGMGWVWWLEILHTAGCSLHLVRPPVAPFLVLLHELPLAGLASVVVLAGAV